jgi:fructose-bisphosphate aldolase class II
MSRVSLNEILSKASQEGYAVGAFNIFNYMSARAVMDAAEEKKKPVIIQTSASTVRQFAPEPLIGMLNALRKGRKYPVLIHLDHCVDTGLAKACVDLGWDSVMIDLSAKSLEENIAGTKDVKEYAAAQGAEVEAELGIISGTEDDVESSYSTLPSLSDTLLFLSRLNIDAFAPAIGTAHGVYKKAAEINYDLVKELKSHSDTPIVVHGGTGLSAGQFRRLISCGASKINISTALKLSYIETLRSLFNDGNDYTNPLHVDKLVEARLRKTVEEHIDIFSGPR